MRVGQPAVVSKTVAQLEERLGVALLLRTSRSFSATEAGRIFYERAKLAIADADEAELAARGASAGLVGRLRVSAAVTFTRLKIVPKLGGFLAQHPKLEIELILDDRNVDLVGEGVDVALRMGVLTDSALTARKIARMRRRVVGTPAYFARAGAPLKPRDLKRHEAIIYTQRGGGAAWTFVKDGLEESVALKGRIRSTAAEAVREAVLGRSSAGGCRERRHARHRAQKRRSPGGVGRLAASLNRPLGRIPHRPPRQRQSAGLRGLR